LFAKLQESNYHALMTELLTVFSSATPTTLFIGGLFLFNLILLILVVILFVRLGKVFKGKNGKDLEAVVTLLVEHKQDAEQFHREVAETFIAYDARIKKSAQMPSVMRFDAFNGTGEGGKQSFATALVSEDGDGMVLSSLYMRDKMRIYAKPVEKYTSSFELTDEEQAVLAKAKK
tara:strand:+ start:300936 stop:301460 length:525 start_codon:yes stop_codon:yes gene_type:complete